MVAARLHVSLSVVSATGDNDPTAERNALIERVRAAVATVRDPEIGLPLGQLGMVRHVGVEGVTAKVTVALTVPGCPMKERIARDVASALAAVAGVEDVEVRFDAMSDAQRGELSSRLRDGAPERYFDDGRTDVIMVASGKGGVGKSTVAANLACAMAARGRRVGLLDADVWGFSIPQMLGVRVEPVAFDGLLFPAQAYGVKLVSVGLFAKQGTPVTWRGPLLHKAMRQFLDDVFWGDLDVLVCDLPPGTGDVPISLAAMLPTARAVIVTTPQDSARLVAERAGHMAMRAKLDVAGVIENMASFVCSACGGEMDVFGTGGGQQLADALATPLLARVPLSLELRIGADDGVPLVVSDPAAPASVALFDAAEQLLGRAAPTGRAEMLSIHMVEPTRD